MTSTRIAAERMAAIDRPLAIALLATAGLGALLAFAQRGYQNADFVGYSIVAARVLSEPAASVTGYWSPLFSWAMAPLLAVGLDDLVAGRIVLLFAALVYVVAVDRCARHARDGDTVERRFVRHGLLAGTVVQAALWSTHLLDPDLLGATGVFMTLALVAGAGPRVGSGRALLIGAAAGFAYFGKAFELLFLIAFVPIALWLLPPVEGRGPWPRSRRDVLPLLRPLALAYAGLALIAGPWIAVLSLHYGHLTFSTAGSSVHANLGPATFGRDLLWVPPLEADYILSPHLEPDWSVFDSWGAAWHQVELLATNLPKGASMVGGPLLLLLVAAIVRRRAGRSALPPLPPRQRRLVAVMLVAPALYLGGYSLLQVGRRYLLPTMVPPLLLAGLLLLAGPVCRALRGRAAALAPLALALLFSGQELRLLVLTATRHPQSAPAGQSRAVATELRRANLADRTFAASQWHDGLFVAHALGATRRYLGTPLADSPESRAAQLAAVGVDCYLDFTPADAGAPLPAPWRCVFASAAARHDGAAVRIYARD